MSAIKEYNLMRIDPRVNESQLKAFRVKHNLFQPGDLVVYVRSCGGPKHVLTVETVSKRFAVLTLRRGKYTGLRVTDQLRHALPHEVARCLHLI